MAGDTVVIKWPDILRIVRANPPESLLETYGPTLKACPECGEPRKGAKLPKRICSDTCLKEVLNPMVEDGGDEELRVDIAAYYAMENKLGNGTTLRLIYADGYRNNGLLFWDAQNQKIVHPFTEIDDYGSVPPIFPVGDGYFNPTDWLQEVEHNNVVFPASNLIREMKAFAAEHPAEKKMIVEINGVEYMVKYDPNVMNKDNNWDSCILSVIEAVTWWGQRQHAGPRDLLHVSPGDPSWRAEIVEESNANIRNKNAALMNLVAKHATGAEGKALVNNEIARHAKSNGGRRTRKNSRKVYY